MQTQIDVSVIVPVYNAEQYLEACVDSILHQKEVSLEVLLLNDCSRDHSDAICRRFAQDARVKYFPSKENHGVSCQRNQGMALFRGEFLMFVDADDLLPEETVDVHRKHGHGTDSREWPLRM